MKKTTLFSVQLLICLLFAYGYSVSQENPDPKPQLTHEMSPEEQALKHLIGKDFYETNPPPSPVRNIAEWEHMEGVLISYASWKAFGIPYSLIAEMSEDVIVYTIVENGSQQNQVTNNYQSNGVNMSNVEFVVVPVDSYWTRDYSPWYITTGNDEVAIINFPYNRPNRPNDDDIPIEMANYFNISLYGMDVIHTGGNYMTDGMHISASTTLVDDENNIYDSELLQRVEDYCGITTYHWVEDPNGEYIDHIDCWGKFLDVDKILIRSVPTSHNQYDEIEDVVDYFEGQTSAYGTPYEIYRVYTPSDQPYSNSLILNNKVFVPLKNSQWDDDAIATYEDAMPGYDVMGIYAGSADWNSTDALHCRTHGVADRGLLHIYHVPITGLQPYQSQYEIVADIFPYSGQSLTSTQIYYQVNGSSFESVNMTLVSGRTYHGYIPVCAGGDCEIGYYIYAADGSGRTANHPYIGAPDPHLFNIDTATGIEEYQSAEIGSYNMPNPFRAYTTIYYTLPEGYYGDVNISVFNMNGMLLKKFPTQQKRGGKHNIVFIANDMPGGIYYYEVQAGNYRTSNRIVHIK